MGLVRQFFRGFQRSNLLGLFMIMLFLSLLFMGYTMFPQVQSINTSFLQLIAKEYSKDIDVKVDDSLVIDRSLDSSKFREATGFQSRSWQEMLATMREFG